MKVNFKMIVGIVVVCFGLLGQSVAEGGQPKDFRGLPWGASASKIISAEGNDPLQQQEDGIRNILVYKDNLAGLDCLVGYILAEDKLVRAKYMINESHSNQTDYLSDYRTLQEGLRNKYGKPVDDQVFWKNDLYKDDPSEWGMAVAVGHLVQWAEWETPRSNIYLVISGDNYSVELTVEYSSKELSGIEKAAKENEEKEKF